MSVVKILAIVVVTSVVAILCIRSGQAMAKASVPSSPPPPQPSPIGRQEAHDRGEPVDPANSDHASAVVLKATTPSPDNASVSFAVIHDPLENRTDHRAPETKNRTGSDDDTMVLTANGSLNATDTVDDGHPSGSRSRSLPIVVRGKLIRPTPYPANQQTIDDDDDDDDRNNRANIIVDTGVYHVDNGPYPRQIDYNHYTTTDTDTSVAQEDGSTSYHNSYDVTYTVAENPNDGSGWNPVNQPISIHGTGSPHPNGNAVVYPMGRPPYGSSVPYPYPVGTGYNKQAPIAHMHYGPPPLVGYNGGHYQHNGQVEQHNVHSPLQQIQMFTDKIDWHKIGILALFKIGLVKLKVFSFLKLLFLLLFKLKLFLIAMFFKFLLIAKLTKLFKLIIIPLIILALLPLIAGFFSAPMLVGGLLSIPGRILEYLTEPVYAPVEATAATAYSAPGGSAVLPTVASAKIGGSPAPSKPGGGELNALNRRRLDTLELFNPAMTVLRKLMDSQKCVERIACRMAVAEKIEILPVWINRVLHQVSKFVPSKKLQSYFKAFHEVNNEIYTQMETPDNWAKWCTERYNCNITHASSKAMNLTDIKQ